MKNTSFDPQTERLVSQVNRLETELLTELTRLYEAAHEPVKYEILQKIIALANSAAGGYRE